MRISSTFVLFALSFIFDGACAWWVAAARGIEPVILSFGAAFAALGLNDQPSHNAQLFDVKGWFKTNFQSKDKETHPLWEDEEFTAEKKEKFDKERERVYKETEDYLKERKELFKKERDRIE